MSKGGLNISDNHMNEIIIIPCLYTRLVCIFSITRSAGYYIEPKQCVIKNILVRCLFKMLPLSCCSVELLSPPLFVHLFSSYRSLRSCTSHCSSSPLPWPKPEDGSGTSFSRPGSPPGRCRYDSLPHCSRPRLWS